MPRAGDEREQVVPLQDLVQQDAVEEAAQAEAQQIAGPAEGAQLGNHSCIGLADRHGNSSNIIAALARYPSAFAGGQAPRSIPRLAKAVAHSKILVHNVKRSSYVL